MSSEMQESGGARVKLVTWNRKWNWENGMSRKRRKEGLMSSRWQGKLREMYFSGSGSAFRQNVYHESCCLCGGTKCQKLHWQHQACSAGQIMLQLCRYFVSVGTRTGTCQFRTSRNIFWFKVKNKFIFHFLNKKKAVSSVFSKWKIMNYKMEYTICWKVLVSI